MEFSRLTRNLSVCALMKLKPSGLSTNVRNRTKCTYLPDLDPLVYDRLDYLSIIESQDNVTEDTKLNI